MRQDAMTSEKVMLSRRRRTPAARRSTFALLALASALAAATLAGCSNGPQTVEQPHVMASPYSGPKLWAVVPFRNESGTTLVDPAALADKLVQQLQQIDGITVLPVNRTLEAMAAMELRSIREVPDAMELMQALDADGLIVGTVTAYDPYEPPKLGAIVQLYSRRHPVRSRGGGLNTRELTYSSTAGLPVGTVVYSQPVAQAEGYFDAANGAVLTRLRDYAHGRVPLESPSGYRRYLLSMDLYAEFVSHELTRRLFAAEWDRMSAERQALETARREAEAARREAADVEASVRVPGSATQR